MSNNMTNLNTYVPEYLVTPGDVLEDHLETLGMTQVDLAKRASLTPKTINEIIKGKAAITPETAIKFERVFGLPAHFWRKLESDYQADKARLVETERLHQNADWLNKIPVREMVRWGWIKAFDDRSQQLNEVLRYFGIDSPDVWDNVYLKNFLAFRQSDHGSKNEFAIAAWLRRGEILAETIPCDEFDKVVFKEALHQARALTVEPPSVFQEQLITLFAPAGVAVVFVPELSQTGVSGCTRWLNKKAIIQLSLRYRTNDHLWFTFFHEAGHILKHGKKTIFYEVQKGTTINDEIKEKEADRFASDFLISPREYRRFLTHWDGRSLKPVEQFATHLGIAPGIVVGRLQHDGHLSFNIGNKLKKRYEWG